MQTSKILKVAAIVLVLGLLLPDSIRFPEPAVAQQCRETYRQDKSRWRNRTAALLIENTTEKSANVTLYHPDSQRSNGTWTIPPKSTVWVPASNYTIGDDWGIGFGECIYYVDEITTYSRLSNGKTIYKAYIGEEQPEFGLDGYLVLKKNRPKATVR